MIPLARYKEFQLKYASRFSKKNSPKFVNTHLGHGVKRPEKLLLKTLDELLKNRTSESTYWFKGMYQATGSMKISVSL